MALSTKSAKALEMAKHALSVLYATDYFTDEEWVKLDGLVHKGKYVWTQGPAPSNLLDGSPLMMSADDKGMATITQAEITEPLDLNAPATNGHHVKPNTPPESPATEGESATTYQSPYDFGLLVDCSGRSEQETQLSTPQPSTPQPSTPQLSHLSTAPSSVRPVQQSPVPNKDPDPLTQANLSTVAELKPNLADLAREFRRKHGREPKSINEIYQPTNPEHWSAIYMKSLSRGSAKTVKSSIAPSNSISNRGDLPKSNRPLLDVPTDSILIVQKGFESPSPLKISVRPGDNIRYSKYVSGTTHVGMNLRTGERGQVSEDIFKDKDGQLRDALFYVTAAEGKGKKSKASRHMSMTSADLRAGVDNMAEQNAAEWNDPTDDETESVITQAQREMNVNVGGQRDMQPEMMKAVVDGVSQMLEEKFQKLMQEREANSRDDLPRKIPTGPSGLGSSRHAPPGGLGTSRHAPEPVKLPKTQTCWFWEKKSCRFTDEECFDLHALSDNPPVLKNGRPTWGDLASWKEASSTVNESENRSENRLPDKTKAMTCWFWANGGCDNSVEDCKFVHGLAAGGIAMKPHAWARKWERSKFSLDWKNNAADEWSTVSADKGGPAWRERNQSDATQEGVAQSSNLFSVLGDNSSDDTLQSQKPGVYKPPQLKALNDMPVGPSDNAKEQEQQQQPEEELESAYW